MFLFFDLATVVFLQIIVDLGLSFFFTGVYVYLTECTWFAFWIGLTGFSEFHLQSKSQFSSSIQAAIDQVIESLLSGSSRDAERSWYHGDIAILKKLNDFFWEYQKQRLNVVSWDYIRGIDEWNMAMISGGQNRAKWWTIGCHWALLRLQVWGISKFLDKAKVVSYSQLYSTLIKCHNPIHQRTYMIFVGTCLLYCIIFSQIVF